MYLPYLPPLPWRQQLRRARENAALSSGCKAHPAFGSSPDSPLERAGFEPVVPARQLSDLEAAERVLARCRIRPFT